MVLRRPSILRGAGDGVGLVFPFDFLSSSEFTEFKRTDLRIFDSESGAASTFCKICTKIPNSNYKRFQSISAIFFIQSNFVDEMLTCQVVVFGIKSSCL